jgi:DNA polymerase
LDFETYYSADYTLSKLSYTDYIRHPEFEVIMCGVKVGTGPTIVLEGKALERRFKQIDWKKTDMLCHNTAFDGFIMSHHYGVIPRKYLDTLAIARGLHGNDIRADLDSVSLFYGGSGKHKGTLESVVGLHKNEIRYGSVIHPIGIKQGETVLWQKMKDYCANDVEQTYMIFHKMLKVLPPGELDKIDIFLRAFCEPVLGVNRKLVAKALAKEIEEREHKLLTAVGTPQEQAKLILLLGRQEALEHCTKEIGSSAKFANILTDMGVIVPMKYSDKQKKDIPALAATDEDFLALQEHPEQGCARSC